MKLKVVKNKNIAFAGFVRNAIDYSKYRWIRKWQKGPLKKIPKDLLKELHSFDDLNSKKSLAIVGRLKKLHDKEWNLHKKKIRIFVKTHQKIFKKYGNFLVKTIPKTTKIQWKYDEILIIPSIYYGATTEDNKIFRGVIGKTKSELRDVEGRLPGLIHELIHVNTLPKFLSKYSKEKLSKYVLHEKAEFKNPNATIEIATMLTANQIIKLTKQKFGIKLEMQKTHPHYEKIIAKMEEDFERITKIRGFYSMRKAIDRIIKTLEV